MNDINYKITLTYQAEDLKEEVLDSLALHEISQTESKSADKLRYIGDERQDEFVDSHVRLAVWQVCASLSGWKATTDFSASKFLHLNLFLSYPFNEDKRGLLQMAVRDWIISLVKQRAVTAMTSDALLLARSEGETLAATQRVMMLLCAADTLRTAV